MKKITQKAAREYLLALEQIRSGLEDDDLELMSDWERRAWLIADEAIVTNQDKSRTNKIVKGIAKALKS